MIEKQISTSKSFLSDPCKEANITFFNYFTNNWGIL